MDEKYKILIERLDYFLSVRSEIDRILRDYEIKVRKIIHDIRFDNGNIELIQELFNIQDKLCVVKYKYQYTVSDFLSNFIYEFDRQDDVSINYLFNKIKDAPDFLI